MVTNPYQMYQQQSVMTASQEDLLIMLYNGCIRFIKQGMQAIDDKDVPRAHTNIVKAQDIIVEFISTLDMRYDVAKSLMPLYDYIYRRLVEANISKDAAILNEALGFVTELRDTWAEAAKLLKTYKTVSR